MKKIVVLTLSFLFFLTTNCFAYVIIAVEEGSVFYKAADNKISESEPAYRVYYEIDEAKKIVKRTKVVLLKDVGAKKKGEAVADDTQYQILDAPKISIPAQVPVTYAIGRPGTTATELLTIGKDFVLSSKHTGDYVVTTNLKIVDRSDVPSGQ